VNSLWFLLAAHNLRTKRIIFLEDELANSFVERRLERPRGPLSYEPIFMLVESLEDFKSSRGLTDRPNLFAHNIIE